MRNFPLCFQKIIQNIHPSPVLSTHQKELFKPTKHASNFHVFSFAFNFVCTYTFDITRAALRLCYTHTHTHKLYENAEVEIMEDFIIIKRSLLMCDVFDAHDTAQPSSSTTENVDFQIDFWGPCELFFHISNIEISDDDNFIFSKKTTTYLCTIKCKGVIASPSIVFLWIICAHIKNWT